jgi:hypothetical protein
VSGERRRWNFAFARMFAFALAPLIAFPSPGFAAPVSLSQTSAATAVTADRYFEYHSGFWINMHLFLYEEAITRSAPPGRGREAEFTADSTISATLTGEEKASWDAAIAYYQQNFILLDLLTNDRMRNIKNTLEDLENSSSLSRSRLEPGLIRVLDNASSVYRTHWWPTHDKANRDWIAAAATLTDRDGDLLTQKIATAYDSTWPDAPLRVDVAGYANSSGAYTTLHPTRITISSLDPSNQKLTALEALLHEASHTMVENVGNLVLQDYAGHRKNAPPDLLHAILYFTSGYYVEQSHSDYIPYADGASLWDQPRWAGFRAALVKDWQPHLEGKVPTREALSQLVSDVLATSH